MAVYFRDAVRASRIKRGLLRLGRFQDLAEHLAARCLVEARIGLGRAHRLEHARDAHGGELGRQHRLRPGRGHEALRGEIVDLVGLRFLDRRDQGMLVQEVARQQRNAIDDVLDAVERIRTGTARDAEYVVAFFQKKLGEIRTVLTGDAGDECAFSQRNFSSMFTSTRAFGVRWRRRRCLSPPALSSRRPRSSRESSDARTRARTTQPASAAQGTKTPRLLRAYKRAK